MATREGESSNQRTRWIESYLKNYRQAQSTLRTFSPTSPGCKKVLESARKLTRAKIKYDPAYFKIPFPAGDVPSHVGVCTDVVVRSLRAIDFDLQKKVHDDKSAHQEVYPRLWSSSVDSNIDHRRVPNLMVYFSRHHSVLPLTNASSDFQPCDIVAWDLGDGITHIGVVSDRKTDSDRHLILHHISKTPTEEDVLFQWKIIGHYSLNLVR